MMRHKRSDGFVVLPTKGIGLPFISYGGSSIMAFLSIAGLLMPLSRELRER